MMTPLMAMICFSTGLQQGQRLLMRRVLSSGRQPMGRTSAGWAGSLSRSAR